MESVIESILKQLGVTGGLGTVLFFVIKSMINSNASKFREQTQAIEKKNEEIARLQEQATRERKAARDLEMSQIKKDIQDGRDSLTKHIAGHVTFEKEILGKIETVYARLNPIGESIAKIQGIMETQQMMMTQTARSEYENRKCGI